MAKDTGKTEPERKVIRPQPGFQWKALSSPADIAILGGSAGAGKTFVLLLEPLRNIEVPGFGATIFRRLSTQIFNVGGLWDESLELYMKLPKGKRPKQNQQRARHTFPGGTKIEFRHLQYDKDVHQFQGAQIPLIGFDELTHFTKEQFFYMLSRNRSTCGVKPLVRATTNPQGRGWVKDLLVTGGWIYPDNYPDEELRGYPIDEMAGVLRFFTRYKGTYIFGDTREEVIEQLPATLQEKYRAKEDLLKTMTFIPGTLEDNQILMDIDPSYEGNLLALDEEEQEQLHKGRWIEIDDDKMRLYWYDALQDMFTNDFVSRGRKKYLTADIAMEGADRFVIGVWEGWVLTRIIVVPKSDGADVLKLIQKIAKEEGIPGRHICFDADGVGNYLKGFLRTAFAFRGGAKPLKHKQLTQNFKNLRAQAYYWLRDKIHEYEVHIDIESQVLTDEIITELNAIRKKERKDGGEPLQLVPKKEIELEIGRSPDLADMIAMRSVFDIKPPVTRSTTVI